MNDPVITPLAVDAAKLMKEAAIAQAEEANKKIQVRTEELKTFIGKTFKRSDGMNPHQTIEIKSYGGIHQLVSGQMAHLFNVEAKNPGSVWSPPATQFLSEHVEVEVKANTINQEVI